MKGRDLIFKGYIFVFYVFCKVNVGLKIVSGFCCYFFFYLEKISFSLTEVKCGAFFFFYL